MAQGAAGKDNRGAVYPLSLLSDTLGSGLDAAISIATRSGSPAQPLLDLHGGNYGAPNGDSKAHVARGEWERVEHAIEHRGVDHDTLQKHCDGDRRCHPVCRTEGVSQTRLDL